jgi:enoyl-CoA hydratase
MTFQNLLWAYEDGILTITINRPDKLNALNEATLMEIEAAFQEADSNLSGLKGIILTGSGEKAFVAGADISEFMGLDKVKSMELAARGQRIFFEIEKMRVPVIAVVNGFALGGGCELSMACHMRIATPNARFGQPEVNLGIIAGYGGTQRLTQYIGKAKSLELHLTADIIDAATAEKWGLVNYVEENKEAALEKAKSILQKISTKGPHAVAKVIECVNAYYTDGVNGFEKEVESFGDLFDTPDVKEGVQAFLEKRKASFERK